MSKPITIDNSNSKRNYLWSETENQKQIEKKHERMAEKNFDKKNKEQKQKSI